MNRDATPADFLGAWAIDPTRYLGFEALARYAPTAPASVVTPPTLSDRVAGPAGRKVAVIAVAGTLMKPRGWFGTSTVQLRREVQQAAADPNVSASLLAIDSPGGTVAGLSDLVEEVRAARKKIPVWAHIDDLGASAAYCLASQCEVVYANSADALVGSIGTMLVVYDTSVMAEREGVKPLVFSTGPLKGAGVPGSRVTEEQRAYFRGLVDGMQQSFDEAVRRGRGLNEARLIAAKSGGVFLAPRAKELGLIDGIRPLTETLSRLAAQK